MIIIEGPDGSGKDTLMANLGITTSIKLKALRGGVGGVQTQDATVGGIGDGSAGWAGDEPALLAYVTMATRHRKSPGAFNRFHLSEAVYGPLLRDKQELDPHELTWLDLHLRAIGVPTILCLPPLATTLANVRQPGRERPKYQTDAFLLAAYERFAGLRNHATIVYDYTRDPSGLTVARQIAA